MNLRSLSTRNRILETAKRTFNREGATLVTTNRLAEVLSMSPGHLYFHFSGKEEIIRELFKMMVKNLYSTWRAHKNSSPEQWTRATLAIFWEYRFFHREMYALRLRDKKLSRWWRLHLKRSSVVWLKMLPCWKISLSPENTFQWGKTFLVLAGSSFHFFESPKREIERDAQSRALDEALKHGLVLFGSLQNQCSKL